MLSSVMVTMGKGVLGPHTAIEVRHLLRVVKSRYWKQGKMRTARPAYDVAPSIVHSSARMLVVLSSPQRAAVVPFLPQHRRVVSDSQQFVLDRLACSVGLLLLEDKIGKIMDISSRDVVRSVTGTFEREFFY